MILQKMWAKSYKNKTNTKDKNIEDVLSLKIVHYNYSVIWRKHMKVVRKIFNFFWGDNYSFGDEEDESAMKIN